MHMLPEENVRRFLAAMHEITDLLETYRECARHLWNVYFRENNAPEREHLYEEIRKRLFGALVLVHIDDPAGGANPTLKVVPIAAVPILIRRPSEDGNWYWDQEQDLQVEAGEIQLLFSDYYDYWQYASRDFRFYLCKILSFPKHSEYEGRDALIEVGHAKVFAELDHVSQSPGG